MRYELSDYEWSVIKPMLPNKPRGIPRVDDRRILNGIFWVLRSGAPWRDLPDSYGPHTTCYNRFVRWRRAGVWDLIMDALAAAHAAAVQMIDTSVVRVHQHGSCIAGNKEQHMGRSRGGLTSKIHAVVDANGLPIRLGLTPGETHDNRLCSVLLTGLRIARTRSASALTSTVLVTWSSGSSTIKQCRRVATRYDTLAANYLAFVKLACIRLWLRVYESTA
jgi:transposase